MVKRIGSYRNSSRHKFSKKNKGIISIRDYFQEFKEGDKVCLKADPAVHASLYPSRFHGKIGDIIGKQGKCFKVKIFDHGCPKVFIVHPVHLKQIR